MAQPMSPSIAKESRKNLVLIMTADGSARNCAEHGPCSFSSPVMISSHRLSIHPLPGLASLLNWSHVRHSGAWNVVCSIVMIAFSIVALRCAFLQSPFNRNCPQSVFRIGRALGFSTSKRREAYFETKRSVRLLEACSIGIHTPALLASLPNQFFRTCTLVRSDRHRHRGSRRTISRLQSKRCQRRYASY